MEKNRGIAKFRSSLCFLSILGVALFFRLINLDKGFNSDEGWLLQASGVSLGELIPFLKGPNSIYPPLTPILLHIWRFVSSSEVWIRCYFVLFGMGLLVLVYQMGKAYLNKRFGLLVLFLASISPLLIWLSQFVRSYGDSAFWTLLSLFFLLKVVKDGNRSSWLGYILSVCAALYTSYFTVVFLLAENVFVFWTFLRKGRLLKKWVFAQLAIAIAFLPGLLLMITQISIARAVDAGWGSRGFVVLGLSVGRHIRMAAAYLGLDPGFLALPAAASTSFPAWALYGGALFAGVLGVGFVVQVLSRKFEGVGPLNWIFPILLFSSFLIYVMFIEVLHFPTQPQYFGAQHVVFIFVLGLLMYRGSKGWRYGMVILWLAVFIFRYPTAIAPEFETKMASRYVHSTLAAEDALLMVRHTNTYINPDDFNAFILKPTLEQERPSADYEPLGERSRILLDAMKQSHKRIWFQRTYGNDEILGANKLIIDWMAKNHYISKEVKKFKRIDIVRFERE